MELAKIEHIIKDGKILFSIGNVRHIMLSTKNINNTDRNIILEFTATIKFSTSGTEKTVIGMIEALNKFPNLFSFRSESGIYHFLNMTHINWLIQGEPDTNGMSIISIIFRDGTKLLQEMSMIDVDRISKSVDLGISMDNFSCILCGDINKLI
jgi:hypothetical protein